MLSHGRVPQISELTAAAAICLTPQTWIDGWNSRYQAAQADITRHLHQINTRLSYHAVSADPIEGGCLGQAAAVWSKPDGVEVIGRALERARAIADLDATLHNTRC